MFMLAGETTGMNANACLQPNAGKLGNIMQKDRCGFENVKNSTQTLQDTGGTQFKLKLRAALEVLATPHDAKNPASQISSLTLLRS